MKKPKIEDYTSKYGQIAKSLYIKALEAWGDELQTELKKQREFRLAMMKTLEDKEKQVNKLQKKVEELEEKRRVIANLTVKINKRRARWKAAAKKWYEIRS
jgi:HPt (histidine-containing phosphotransfer) domain-containing protein